MTEDQKLLYISHFNLNFTSGSFRDCYQREFGRFPCPIDRFGLFEKIGIHDPFSFKNIVANPIYNFSNLSNNWQDRYVVTYEQVATKVYSTAGNRNIAVMYSGGIDSTAVLVALMQNPQYRDFLDSGRFRIALTSTSIHEYPEFFYRTILPNIPIEPTDYDALMQDDTTMLVTGDDGDHVIGNTDTPEFSNVDGYLMLPKSEIFPYFNNTDPSGLLAYTFDQLCNHAPFDVESVCQLYWWVGQCLEMQATMCRPYFWSHTDNLSDIATNQKVYRFFMDDLWNTFSFEYMSTNPTYNQVNSIRDFPRQYIVNYTGDSSYLNKSKVLSQKLVYRNMPKTRIYADLTYRFDTVRFNT